MIWLILSAQAATLRVDPGDSGAYATVASAIAAAASGDAIEIAAGTYDECLDTAGLSLTLRGEGVETVLDGTGCAYTLVVDNGEAVTLEDLSMTATGGRGVYAAYSSVTLTRVTASGLGHSGAYGGALESYVSTLRLEDCVFEDNVGLHGGALYVAYYSDLADSGTVYANNTAMGDGGAAYTYGYDVLSFDDVTFIDNQAAGGGGAMLNAWDSGLSVTDSNFLENVAAGSGGAVYTYAVDPDASFSGTRFEGNRAGGNGGALAQEWYTAITFEDCDFVNNTAGSWGGAVFSYVLDALDISSSRFCANEAAYGGALGVQWTGTDSLTNSVLIENTAAQGGAVYRYASGAGLVQNNTWVANTSSDWGGAYYAGWYAYGTFTNNLVVDSQGGTGAYASDPYDYGYTTFTHDGWSGNEPQEAGGYFYVVSGEQGHVVADPLFVSWSANGDCGDDDLRLSTGSPMRDAGDPAVLDPDGSTSDIGAWGGPAAPVEDRDGDGFDTTTDCDDTNTAIGPGAVEICDGLDNDCDGETDGLAAAGVVSWYTDWDGDGHGDAGTETVACDAPAGAVADGTDCDDQNPHQSPGVAEICGDGFDQDCSGEDAACDTGEPVAAEEVVKDDGGCGCASGGRSAGLAAGLAMLAVLGRRRPI